MNEIIINGKSSNDFVGLIIQELPSIIKPELSTEIENIPGKNGANYFELGYLQYEKEFTIGLFGNYNIDKIIGFFNQKGQVIFSNEPDKIYNFRIYKQIDFERLIKFRTAKVSMLVEPFKEPLFPETYEFSTTYQSNNFKFINKGNIYSKPKLTITTNDIIDISFNQRCLFTIKLLNEPLIIDLNKMTVTKQNGNPAYDKVEDIFFDRIKIDPGENILNTYFPLGIGGATIKIENATRFI